MENNINIGLWKFKNNILKLEKYNNIYQYVYPCARNCITQFLKDKNYSRNDYIVVQEYIGYCVLSAINKIATAVPFKLINNLNYNHIKSILIYNQWGWERSQDKINELKSKFKNIILDRVDTLIDYNDNENHYLNVDCEIFSLNKTLGIGGGGLLWVKDKYRDFPDNNVSIQEKKIMEYLDDINYDNFGFIDHLIKNNCTSYSKKFKKTLKNIDINLLVLKEIESRKKNLKIMIDNFEDSLPLWMINNYENDKIYPGIFPLRLKDKSKYNFIIYKMKSIFNINSQIYNFNFSDNYLDYIWEKVIPIPLHSDVNPDKLVLLIHLIKDIID